MSSSSSLRLRTGRQTTFSQNPLENIDKIFLVHFIIGVHSPLTSSLYLFLVSRAFSKRSAETIFKANLGRQNAKTYNGIEHLFCFIIEVPHKKG